MVAYSLTKVTSAAAKGVTCEECGCEFHYHISHAAYAHTVNLLPGQGLSQDELNRTSLQLDYSMKKSVDLVSCPGCQHFQKHMVSAFRWKLVSKFVIWWLVSSALLLVFANVLSPVAQSSTKFRETLFKLEGVNVVIWVVGLVAARLWYDPNKGRFLKGRILFFSDKYIDRGMLNDASGQETKAGQIPKKRLKSTWKN